MLKKGLVFGLASVLMAAMPAHPQTSDAVTYTYDALGRLVASSVTGGPNNGTQTSIAYDHAGNRTNYSVSTAGSPTCSLTASPNEEGSDEFSQYPYIVRSGICSGPVELSFTVERVSGSGTYNVSAHETTGPFYPENTADTARYVRVSPWPNTIQEGDDLIVKVIWTIVSGSANIVDADTQLLFYDD